MLLKITWEERLWKGAYPLQIEDAVVGPVMVDFRCLVVFARTGR